MNTTIISILTTISISFFALNASGQTYPGKALQRQMQTEETAFLANMRPGLQHTQMLAVRDAMKGQHWNKSARAAIRRLCCRKLLNPSMLRRISASFILSMPLNVNVLCCFIFMAEDGVSEA